MLIGLGINYYASEQTGRAQPLWVYNLISVPIWAHSKTNCGQLRLVFKWSFFAKYRLYDSNEK